jgi:hypothetical protein
MSLVPLLHLRRTRSQYLYPLSESIFLVLILVGSGLPHIISGGCDVDRGDPYSAGRGGSPDSCSQQSPPTNILRARAATSDRWHVLNFRIWAIYLRGVLVFGRAWMSVQSFMALLQSISSTVGIQASASDI